MKHKLYDPEQHKEIEVEETKGFDMWEVWSFLNDLKETDLEKQAKAVTKNFDVSLDFARAIVKRINEIEEGRGVPFEF